MAHSFKSAEYLLASRLADADRGDASALYDLGMVYSTGTCGMPIDLLEAHKWFNLAALRGHREAQLCRAELAEEMTAPEIAAAQRAARAWLDRSPVMRPARTLRAA